MANSGSQTSHSDILCANNRLGEALIVSCVMSLSGGTLSSSCGTLLLRAPCAQPCINGPGTEASVSLQMRSTGINTPFVCICIVAFHSCSFACTTGTVRCTPGLATEPHPL